MSLFVKVHVRFGTSYYNLSLICVKTELISLGVMGYNAESTLKGTGRASKHIGVVSNTYRCDADIAHHESKS